jgi:type III restriction enzyme
MSIQGDHFEVESPILNSPFLEPKHYWYLKPNEAPKLSDSRRPSIVFRPRDQRTPWDTSDGTLRDSKEFSGGYELVLVNLIRDRVNDWRRLGYPGVTRTTLELLNYWRREGRQRRLFYAQLEAAETVIFLKEARGDLLQGISVPPEKLPDNSRLEGNNGFQRYACKMATGSGKSTVMAMLAAWSILNKCNSRQDSKFSDVVLIVCPNVTIRDRLRELLPSEGEASIYRTRDLVPAHLMSSLLQGRIIITNWHVFQPQSIQAGGISGKVLKAGVPVQTVETINIAAKNTSARGQRYMTLETFNALSASGGITVLSEEKEKDGTLKKVKIESTYYVESDTALVNRIIGREAGGKQNILVLNDEAHHAYRIHREEDDDDSDDDGLKEFYEEAAVWVQGLDRINKHRGVNFTVDLSATPYFLGRAGQDTNRPFPWVVSDFGLIEAIESGLVKIPQMAVRDTTGKAIPGFFNIWEWVMGQLTSAEKGARKGTVKPEAVLKYAHTPIAMLGGLYQELFDQWMADDTTGRPPVFIIVCKNTQIADVIYRWLALDDRPTGIPQANLKLFRNQQHQENTIRIDSKVSAETDGGGAIDDKKRWMRFTLDTVGKQKWPTDSQGRPLYPDGFLELAKKLEKPLDPPGATIRCIVSVSMLTEGWDCNTVTHIIGLRPFMSQLLCEQVVGRGLRRASYDVVEKTLPSGELGEVFGEEVAKVFGVPFEVIPFKANAGPAAPREKRNRVFARPDRANLEIKFPRVERFSQGIRNRITVDWEHLPPLMIEPNKIPPYVEMKGIAYNTEGKMSLHGPGKIDDVTLAQWRDSMRLQEIEYQIASDLTRYFIRDGKGAIPTQALFPQVLQIVKRFVKDRVTAAPPSEKKDVFLSPYYGWAIDTLLQFIKPDTSQGEAPELPVYERNRKEGTTADVDFWTSRDCREVIKSHLNAVVADTKSWEQQATFYIDKHPKVESFVKNAGLGFAIPYNYKSQSHDYEPDFIIRLKDEKPIHLILETKGFDEKKDFKIGAANRWVKAVNAEGTYGHWEYRCVEKMTEVAKTIDEVIESRRSQK